MVHSAARPGAASRWAIVGATLDLVLPRRCVGCGAPATAWCATCLAAARRPVCRRAAGRPVWAGAVYVDPVRAALVQFKERGRRDLGPALGALLHDAVDRLPTDVVVVPVPISRAARRVRGFDQVRILARRCARPVRPVLATAAHHDSVGLGRSERARNVAATMRVVAPPPLGRRRCIVVDDVVTTGATIGEAFRALAEGGWDPVGAAAVAAVERQDQL
jgi:ComF family protein